MKTFEMSSLQQNGKRHFKLSILRIEDDSCVVNETGTDFNENGITWLEEYVNNNIKSIIGMSLTAEFLDDERTELCGHGDNGEIKDGIPLFPNATVIGQFTDAYISEIDIDESKVKVLIGEGDIDNFRYKALCDKLDERLALGDTINGSVEIFRTADNDSIVYKYGWKEKGRIPKEFIFSGYALLGIKPADQDAILIELNKKANIKEDNKMELDEIKKVVKDTIIETNAKNEVAEKKVAELNSTIEEKDAKINELNANISTLQKALDDLRHEQDTSWEEMEVLKKEIAKYRVAERVRKLEKALEDFSDEEKKYAESEIDSFKENPDAQTDEKIEEIKNEIFAKIGQAKKDEDKKMADEKAKQEELDACKKKEVSEKNSAEYIADIFGDIDDGTTAIDDVVSIW